MIGTGNEDFFQVPIPTFACPYPDNKTPGPDSNWETETRYDFLWLGLDCKNFGPFFRAIKDHDPGPWVVPSGSNF